jgi:hypothetical protein
LAISWARLVSGRFTDALVGRDILIGMAAALVVCLLDRIPRALPWWINLRYLTPEAPISEAISGTSAFIGQFFNGAWNALFIALLFLFIVTLGRMMFKRGWAGALTLLLVLVALDALSITNPTVQIASVLVGNAVLVFVLVRVGPVALAALMATQMLVSNAPFAIDVSAWYAGRSFLTIAILVALALFAFKNSLAGRPLFATEADRERSAAAAV